MKQKLLQGKKLEWTVFGLLVILYCIISSYHEPWFDEAQAWQIAKCASFREIFFEIPHYECHPPLWHLILAIPAKLGVPFEPGLKSIGLIIYTVSLGTLLFHSKMPRVGRLLLPFTYFFFYQYGIIVRPYGLMLFLLLLLGINFSDRNTHPYKICLLLFFLCLTSTYGMIIAAGIAVGIVIELLKEKGIRKLICNMFHDQRSLALLALLLGSLVLILELFPAVDVYGMRIEGDTPIWLCFVCAFFSFPLNCLFLSSSWMEIEKLSMRTMTIGTIEMISCSIVGALFWFLIICLSSKKSIKYIIIPFAFFSLFTAAGYFSVHHLGITLLLLLFYIELLCRDENHFEIGRAITTYVVKTEKDRKLVHIVFFAITAVCICAPIFWNCATLVNEIKYNYSYGRNVANYIEDNHLEGTHIFSDWHMGLININDYNEGQEDYLNTYIIHDAVPVAAYFHNNIFYNLNEGNDNRAFVYHRVPSYNQCRLMAEEWKEAGSPDVILGHPKLEYVYDDVTYDDYSLAEVFEFGFIWKDKRVKYAMPLYIKKSLIDELGIETIDNMTADLLYGGLCITDEMREQFENGVPVEEILKPYLDAMFGPEK